MSFYQSIVDLHIFVYTKQIGDSGSWALVDEIGVDKIRLTCQHSVTMNVDSTIEFVALDDSEWQQLVECPGMLL